ncbi:MAG: CDP-diacylglycerol--glycerol-3-phosphate 3-phosphatidyltransferase [Sphingomonadales bacterium]
MFKSLPNLLTISRILVLPALVATFYYSNPIASWVALGLFIAAGVTDFFDGYLARTWNVQSKLGQFLDPVADKLLVATVILMLVFKDRIEGLTVLAALVILCREILVSGLREFLAQIKISVPVSRLAKWKTTVQMVAIGFLLLAPDATPFPTPAIGEIGLWIAAMLTLYTGYDYLRTGLKHMTGPHS